jgi:uncharacterized protein YacL
MTTTTKTQVKKRSPYVIGLIVGIVLAVLTGIEYFVGTHYPSAVFLMLISVLKAILVIYFFMHVYRLWRTQEEH